MARRTSGLMEGAGIGSLLVPPDGGLPRTRRLFPPGTRASSGDRVAADGTITTSRQTPQQAADQAAFDRANGFGQQSPAAQQTQQILANRSARLAKDPYDLDYAENTTGTFGSSNAQLVASRTPQTTLPAAKPPVSAPVAPGTSAMAVRATGNTAALDSAGASVLPGPAINQAALPMGPYNRTAQFAPNPNKFVASPNNVVNQVATDQPTAYVAPTQPTPTPGPAAVTATAPTPTASPYSTPPPVPTATPTATPQIQPTPGGRTTEAGVSRAQAAGFDQPTAQTPIPKTPTSPAMDVDELDRRNKKAFAGF